MSSERVPYDEASSKPALLCADIQVRLVDVSERGCLLEAWRPIAPGTTGRLRIEIGGMTLQQDLCVARCQQLDRTGSIYRVGARFVEGERPEAASLHGAVHALGSARNNGVFVEQMTAEQWPAPARGRTGDPITSGGAKP